MHISNRPEGTYKRFDNTQHEYKQDYLKLYLIEPEFVDTGEKFNKFGVTSFYNAEKRFDPKHDVVYNFFKQPVRVLASAWLPKLEALKQERYLQNLHPKNIHLDVYFGGVSECLLLNKKDRSDSIGYIMDLHKRYKMVRRPAGVAS